MSEPQKKPACEHKLISPPYDEQAAKGLSVHEVRERWPRFDGICPECRQKVIVYASFLHFLRGDW